jgi:hypothetical protein
MSIAHFESDFRPIICRQQGINPRPLLCVTSSGNTDRDRAGARWICCCCCCKTISSSSPICICKTHQFAAGGHIARAKRSLLQQHRASRSASVGGSCLPPEGRGPWCGGARPPAACARRKGKREVAEEARGR